ncbi:MAG: hypothetical protein K2L20_00825 [Ligilactobacillus sp.]|nr:hypothetical protein [Ligilactobacillus sp.]
MEQYLYLICRLKSGNKVKQMKNKKIIALVTCFSLFIVYSAIMYLKQDDQLLKIITVLVIMPLISVILAKTFYSK